MIQMNRTIKKILICLLLVELLFMFSSCSKNDELEEKIEYPEVNIMDYDKMDKYETSYIEEKIKYNYTFYFDDDKCMNVLVSITFNNVEEANKYYESIKDDNDYINLNIEKSIVKYYYNSESFIYMMYSKDMIIDLLSKKDFIIE